MIGTVMAANVFFDIIPAHWELIRAKEAGREPDPRPGIQAKQRSVHNNYLTLPVLLTMLAGHFPFAYGADHAWLVLVALMLLGAWARLFFNLRHQGRTLWWMPVAGAVAFVALAVLVERSAEPTTPSTPGSVAEGKAVFASAGCGACHALADAGASGSSRPGPRRRDTVRRARGRPRAERAGRDAGLRRRADRRRDRGRGGLRRRGGGVGSRPDAPDQRRRVRLHRAPRGGGRARDGRGLPPPPAARVADHPRPLVGRGRVDSLRRPRPRSSVPRTRPRIRTRASSSSIPVASPRRRSCSRTATSTSPRRPVSSRGTTSRPSSRATRTCGRSE